MITLNLTRGADNPRVQLDLPATPENIGEAYAKLDVINPDKVLTRIASAMSPVRGLGYYLLSADLNLDGSFAKLNAIAEKVDGMDNTDRQRFAGVLAARSINGIDDVLAAADAMDEYIFHPQITTERELGVFLVENRLVAFDEKVRPYLDYSIIGTEYHANHSGAFMPEGYVVRRSEEAQQKSPPMFRVLLWSEAMRDADVEPYSLELPATDLKLEQALRGIGVRDFTEAEIVSAECFAPELYERIPMEGVSIGTLNELARCMQEMKSTEGEYEKFLAILDIEQPGTVSETYSLVGDMGKYTLLPDDAAAYGREALERLGADEELLAELDGFIDFDKYGRHAMEADSVRVTAFGILRREGNPFPDESMGQQMM